MDLEEKWQRTLEETKVLKFYHPNLSIHEATDLPYIFLGASVVNPGDTVVRKGHVTVDKPFIVLPQNMPQFAGFDFEQDLGTTDSDMQLFLMVRGIHFPSLKYKNESSSIEVLEKDPERLLEEYQNEIDRMEDILTGLILGPAECWQLSLLVYVGTVAGHSAARDIERYLKNLRKQQPPQ